MEGMWSGGGLRSARKNEEPVQPLLQGQYLQISGLMLVEGEGIE